MKGFLQRHSVLVYYVLVFAISWGGILILIDGPGNIPGSQEQAEQLFIPALIIMFAGPFLSGILMNFFMDGKEGLRKLLSRYFHWRTEGRWYVIAIFTGPILVITVLLGLSLFNHEFLPGIITVKDKIGSVIFGVAWGLIGGGLLEETGWTGFVVPQLQKQYSIFTTGIIVGILWGIWHFMIAFWASNYLSGVESWTMFVAGFLAFYLLALPAYRILLVLVYDRTRSLPVVMLMHAFLSASTLIFQPTSTGEIAFLWNAVLGILLWIIIAMLGINNHLHATQKTNKIITQSV
jgi:membrane protease YdiL (CAAX protease family)